MNTRLKNQSKSLIYPLFILCAFFVSCSDDDEEDNLLVGTWSIQTTDIDVLVNGEDYVDYLVNTFGLSMAEAQLSEVGLEEEASVFDDDVTLSLSSSGNYTAMEGSESFEGTWTANADNTMITFDQGTSDEIAFNIVTLTDSQMVLEVTEEEQEDLDDDGTSETLSISISMTFTR